MKYTFEYILCNRQTSLLKSLKLTNRKTDVIIVVASNQMKGHKQETAG